MPPAPDAVAARLAADADPAIRALARRDLLGDPAPDEDALRSPLVRGLLAGLEDRAVLERSYAKRTGAHWRLVSLVELGVPAGYGPAVRAVDWGDVAHQMVTLNALRVTRPAVGTPPAQRRPSPAPPAGPPGR